MMNIQFAVYGTKDGAVSTLSAWGEQGKIACLTQALEQNASEYYDNICVEWRDIGPDGGWATLVTLFPHENG